MRVCRWNAEGRRRNAPWSAELPRLAQEEKYIEGEPIDVTQVVNNGDVSENVSKGDVS